VEDLLFLSHRIPYPPNKGDKVRSFHMLRHLAAHYRVHLGAFVDQPEDWARADELRQWCASLQLLPLHPRRRKLAALRGLLTGEALSLPYYRSRALQRWVGETVSRTGLTRCVVFSSPMAQYVIPLRGLRRVADYCDVDSAKWTDYAAQKSGPMAWLYRREGARLLAFEAAAASRCEAVTLVAEHERALFASLAPSVADRVSVVENGVDGAYFAPDLARPDPFAGGLAVVFTGAMDYWPNVDAVDWFARQVWPGILARHPQAGFWIVGMNPAAQVQALAGLPGVRVTGSVPDVRPYLQHARVVVAPLRIARGIQNKVLEAMALDRPVVAHANCATPLSAARVHGLAVADSPESFVAAVDDALARGAPVGERSPRAYVLARHDWAVNMARYVSLLEAGQA
jgi:sugar transferase (PEP-CTERM/EpsH1 system associated)